MKKPWSFINQCFKNKVISINKNYIFKFFLYFIFISIFISNNAIAAIDLTNLNIPNTSLGNNNKSGLVWDKTNAVMPYKKNIGGITYLALQGSHHDMGIQYGKLMHDELVQSLTILLNYYMNQHNVPYEKMLEKANAFYERFPSTYQIFIQGVAEGSGLNLDCIKILNAMETMSSLISNKQGSCSFIFIPPNKTKNNSALIGRNYDFPPPFDQIAKYLTVVTLQEQNEIESTIIGLPGQIYCPTCVNSAGLFMELNNGTPSGGKFVDQDKETLLVRLLQTIQNSKDMSQMEKQLNATQSDYSLIINTADAKQVKSYEFSSTLGMKDMFPPSNSVFVSTNFYLSDAWQGIPNPSDDTTWLGVTRRNNLLKLAAAQNIFDIDNFKTLMDTDIKNGGAVWPYTIYQIIFDTSNNVLYTKVNNLSNNWVPINVGSITKHTIQ